MIHVKDRKQYDMFNPFAHLGPKRLAFLESSWAHLFQEEILLNLPAEKLFPLYNEHQGRRTKELYAMLGIALLQQQQDLTDEETIPLDGRASVCPNVQKPVSSLSPA